MGQQEPMQQLRVCLKLCPCRLGHGLQSHPHEGFTSQALVSF